LKILPPKISGTVDSRKIPVAISLACHQWLAMVSGLGISPPSRMT
jgi:hypothetical protein